MSQSTTTLTLRHLEIYVLKNAFRLIPLHQLESPRALWKAMRGLIQAIEEAAKKGVIHRDISANNVLSSHNGHVHLIDFDCATTLEVVDLSSSLDSNKSVQVAAQEGRTGTPPTMAKSVLRSFRRKTPFKHLVRHDLESTYYLLLNTLSVILQRITVSEDGKVTLKDILELFAWEKGDPMQIYKLAELCMNLVAMTALICWEKPSRKRLCSQLSAVTQTSSCRSQRRIQKTGTARRLSTLSARKSSNCFPRLKMNALGQHGKKDPHNGNFPLCLPGNQAAVFQG